MTGAGLDPVERWQRRLADRVGMGNDERNELRTQVLDYCERHDLTPAELLCCWSEHPELTVRRRPGCTERSHLAVESFLIHNGINVFGEIVCVPGRPEDLAEQGPWFSTQGSR